MAGARVAFRAADVSRAVKGFLKTGLQVSRVEISQTGNIVILAKGTDKSDAEAVAEKWEAEYRARSP